MKTKASKATPSTTTVQAEPPSTATLALDAPEGALIQAQLYIGHPGGRYEREANALADRAMQMLSSGNTPAIQSKCENCEEAEWLQRKEAPAISPLSGSPADAITASPQITSQLAQRRGGGEALPEQTQAEMEAAFGADFSRVRVHADSRAAGLSRELGARAFTHGADVYFNEGEYRPQSAEGRRLLGHELVHVVQQGSMNSPAGPKNIQRVISRVRRNLYRISLRFQSIGPFRDRVSHYLGHGQRDLPGPVSRRRAPGLVARSNLDSIYEQLISHGAISGNRVAILATLIWPEDRSSVQRIEFRLPADFDVQMERRADRGVPQERPSLEEIFAAEEITPEPEEEHNAPPLQEERVEPQNLALDYLGWYIDYMRVHTWLRLEPLGLQQREYRGRAARHLLHNMTGSGDPVTVPREWIMDSRIWREGYQSLLEEWDREVLRRIAGQFFQVDEGGDHFSVSSRFGALPHSYHIFPWCEEADQFYGSSMATFTVEGYYSWSKTALGLEVEVEKFERRGSFHDRYVWEHFWDPGQHSRQERGWYTPFDLVSNWEEPDLSEVYTYSEVLSHVPDPSEETGEGSESEDERALDRLQQALQGEQLE